VNPRAGTRAPARTPAAIPTGETPGKRAAVQRLFAAISPRYDLLNRLLSAGQDQRWRRRAVRLFGPEVRRVLDVAAGTGDLGAAWLSERPGGELLATDFVPAMCAAAAAKLAGRPGYRGSLVADALALPLADGAVDGAMVAFGVRNFENLAAGLRELARVLRPGGELVVLEFFPPRHPAQERLFRFYFQRVLPHIGGWISGDAEAYRYLPRSVSDFVDRERFAVLLADAGLSTLQVREFGGGIATAFHARKPLA
jgi:demethylmenaquinone methyltransferase/2-methoxy-6-polyprenyl-1,4-benzoquinol methylase